MREMSTKKWSIQEFTFTEKLAVMWGNRLLKTWQQTLFLKHLVKFLLPVSWRRDLRIWCVVLLIVFFSCARSNWLISLGRVYMSASSISRKVHTLGQEDDKGQQDSWIQGLFSRAIWLLLMSFNSIGTGNHQRASINVCSRKVVGRLYSTVS